MRSFWFVAALGAAPLLAGSATAEGLIRPAQARPAAAAHNLPVATTPYTSAAELGVAMRAGEHPTVTAASLTVTTRPPRPAKAGARSHAVSPGPGGR